MSVSIAVPAAIADEVALVLVAEGLEAEVWRDGQGTVVRVPDREAERAAAILTDEYPEGLVAAVERSRKRPQRSDLPDRWFGRGSWVLFLIAGTCAAIYLGEEASGGSETREVLLRFGASRPAHVRSGEWWRLVTAMFVHIGPRHLLGNVAALVVLAPSLVAVLGPGRFAFIYVVAGMLGNISSYWVAPSDMVSAGASGAILGVLGALGGQRIRFAASSRFRTWQVVAALLAYLGVAVGAEPGVDNMAHLGGFAAGFALGFVVPPSPEPAARHDASISAACGAVAAAIVVVAYAAHLASPAFWR